tara:strand:- start:501 stop:1508 length:1008 start_codon:yes stop_codon:yes gene_type:complete
MKIIVTGGSGFIGSHLVKFLIKKKHKVLNIDKLSKYSVNEALINIKKNHNYSFKKIDLQNFKKLNAIVLRYKPDAIFNLAAESHVDRSIEQPKNFVKSNINSTINLLEISRNLLNKNKDTLEKFKFIHVSTDEIYGSLNKNKKKFSENSKINPSSPYSASKASTDLIVQAWNKTYKLPTIITNCSNNFGPWQYPEKLMPVIILKILNKERIPIYGNGKNIRDWIYVLDHVNGLYKILKKGKIGETYNIGTNNEFQNIDICKKICKKITKLKKNKFNYLKLIKYVSDRKGHDLRYAINSNKIKTKLGFRSKYKFENSLDITIKWYLKHYNWLKNKI